VRWNRRFELPPDARETLGLQRRERVLAAAQLADGSWAAATPNALLLVGRRLDWVWEVVFERVTASIVASRHVPVQGRAGVRVVARRDPGQDDPVWQVVVDRGLDPADPRVGAASEAVIADLRRELGV